MLYRYIHRFCLLRVMVTMIFLIKIQMKVNFYKNVSIKAFCHEKNVINVGTRQICAESDQPLLALTRGKETKF